jgi:hypothetical protein
MKQRLLGPAIVVLAMLGTADFFSHPAPAPPSPPPAHPKAGRDRPPPLSTCLLNSPWCLTLAGTLAIVLCRAALLARRRLLLLRRRLAAATELPAARRRPAPCGLQDFPPPQITAARPPP